MILGEPIVAEPGEKAAVAAAPHQGRDGGLLDEAQRSYPDQPAGPDDRWWLPAHLGGTAPTPEEAALHGRRPRRRARREGAQEVAGRPGSRPSPRRR